MSSDDSPTFRLRERSVEMAALKVETLGGRRQPVARASDRSKVRHP